MARLESTIGYPFEASIRRLWDQLSRIVNGKISFGDGLSPDNIDGVIKTAVSVAGNFVVTHNLNRIPTGYWVTKSDAFENLKFVSATTTQITLAGQNGGANLSLFIF